MAANIPKIKTIDSSLSLLREGFLFIPNRCKKFNSDIFQTRFLGFKAICLHGQQAAQVFYDPEKFVRKKAIPKPIQKTLLGENGVQTLDDAAHRHRKEMFMSLMTPQSIHQLNELVSQNWLSYLAKWEKMNQVVLFTEVQEIFCRSACAWAGVPLAEEEVKKRAQDFTAMVDAFGAVGLRHWRGRRARSRTEKWVMQLIKKVRNHRFTIPEGTPLAVIAWHKEPDGQLLDLHMAAVELMNLLRPIVAISWYVVFSALALHQYPDCRPKSGPDEDAEMERFVQEVRRFYPFGPFTGARVRSDFEWKGYQFQKGTLVFLDIYGTNHDARLWENPDTFWPGRFRNWSGSPFDFIPQGGGEYLTGHRCAGEWITIELTKIALQFLTQGMAYEVPEQDLGFSLSRMPTYPRSKFIIRQVTRTGNIKGTVTGNTPQCPFHKG